MWHWYVDRFSWIVMHFWKLYSLERVSSKLLHFLKEINQVELSMHPKFEKHCLLSPSNTDSHLFMIIWIILNFYFWAEINRDGYSEWLKYFNFYAHYNTSRWNFAHFLFCFFLNKLKSICYSRKHTNRKSYSN